jgi:hypothetical protein
MTMGRQYKNNLSSFFNGPNLILLSLFFMKNLKLNLTVEKTITYACNFFFKTPEPNPLKIETLKKALQIE